MHARVCVAMKISMAHDFTQCRTHRSLMLHIDKDMLETCYSGSYLGDNITLFKIKKWHAMLLYKNRDSYGN
jgi:hypothetical protein